MDYGAPKQHRKPCQYSNQHVEQPYQGRPFYALMKPSSSSLTRSFNVVHMPCGAPL
jgi:hypothetical protein